MYNYLAPLRMKAFNKQFFLQALFKVHFTPKDLGSTKLLLETRDRCNNNSEDFLDYKVLLHAGISFSTG